MYACAVLQPAMRTASVEARRPRLELPPFPAGWFVLCFSQELPPEGVLRRQAFGRELVVFRSASGRAAAFDAYCPHMGAHLAYGGRVEGDTLRCPMHGFHFDRQGRCVATAYGSPPPPKCSTPPLELRELNGVVLAFHDPDGRAPTWEVPDYGLSAGARLWTHTVHGLPSHPQETTENSIDLGHFAAVHGYEDVVAVEPAVTAGPHLKTHFRFVRRPMFPGGRRLQTEIRVHVWGLGFSYVETEVRSHGFRARQLVLPTPTDGAHVDLRLASALVSAGRVADALPRWVVDRTLGVLVLQKFLEDVRQDFQVWSNKRYLDNPALARGDGPIGLYRKWSRQFYAGGEA